MKTDHQISAISVETFDYNLPDECIAKYPLEQRDKSKLLFWNNGKISDHTFQQLPSLLPENSLLVFNNTRVIRARLHFTKKTGARIEIFILDPHQPSDYALNFQQTRECSWKCIVGNLKKWKSGELTHVVSIGNETVAIKASQLENNGDTVLVKFEWGNPRFTFAELLDAAGSIPIPPYLNRESETIDQTRYQTVYSKIKGSVAAPTAGLHFTDEVLNTLSKRNISTAELTLHVGAGTFQPVKSETIARHEMHTEHFSVNRALVEKLMSHNGKVIAVGTTSVRTLESIYWLGCKLKEAPKSIADEMFVEQWEPYQNNSDIEKTEALGAIISYMDMNHADHIEAATQIIIVPGYQFKIVEGLITNFHQPKSTLLLLISAYVGNDWQLIYAHALTNEYRFLSYGDSNLYLK